MYRILIIIALFSISGTILGQDSLYVRRKISDTDIGILFSMYAQDGDHSAVTGGKGTEKLQVYAPQVTLSHAFDSVHTILFDAGIDFITSASTDRIDYQISSASYHDANFQFQAGYSHYFKKPALEAGLTGSFSMESDFLSGGFNIWLYKTSAGQNSSYYAGFQAFFDDMRWGRLNPDYKRPVTLIYPIELRDTNWFDIYMRYSCNINLGYEQVINKRMIFGIYPGFIIQSGLLSTPFHRVYFMGIEEARVENLPVKRIKIPVGMKFNAYIGTGLILNSHYRFYADDFGIFANTVATEAFYKVSPYLAPSLSFRFYQQTASSYFKPHGEHYPGEKYYTSDYDLSRFYSLEAGGGIRFAALKRIFRGWTFDEIDLKYSFYWRSDGLKAHFMSTYFGVGNNK